MIPIGPSPPPDASCGSALTASSASGVSVRLYSWSKSSLPSLLAVLRVPASTKACAV